MVRIPDEPKLVTILVPTFKRESQLKVTLSTLEPYLCYARILVINDGGDKIDLPNTEIDLINLTENIGEAAVVNLGWKIAQTPFFTVISDDDPQSDDWLLPLLDVAKKAKEVIAIYPSTRVLYEDGRKKEYLAKVYNSKQFVSLLRSPCLSGVVINRKKLLSKGVKELRIDGMLYPNDLIQWLELSKHGEFVGVPSAFGQWHIHNAQLSNKLSGDFKSKQFYENVSLWQRENLPKQQLPRALSITFLRSCQIIVSSPNVLSPNSLRFIRKLIARHRFMFKESGGKRLLILGNLLYVIIQLLTFKVKNARN
jgi:glycosyltransferase involved in cell wall biosynthesis